MELVLTMAISPPVCSVVLPTRNRLSSLRRAINSCASCEFQIEIIVVDGASTDGTHEWLSQRKELTIIHETHPSGWVRAMNQGLAIARGEFLAWLNDDAEFEPYAIENAVNVLRLKANHDVGIVAMYHDSKLHASPHDELLVSGRVFQVWQVRGIPFANFGVVRRSVFAQVGGLDERFVMYGADPDWSIRIQQHGFRLMPLPSSRVVHYEISDETRAENESLFLQDNARLCEKYGWKLGSF